VHVVDAAKCDDTSKHLNLQAQLHVSRAIQMHPLSVYGMPGVLVATHQHDMN
jgi:hypothetical protein